MSNANPHTADGSAGTNDTRRNDLVKAVRELGRNSGKGSTALFDFGKMLAKGISDGVISLEQDADGKDDVHHMYKEYREAESSKAAELHTANGVKANESKARAICKASALTTVTMLDVFQDSFNIREELNVKKEKTVAPFPAMVNVARAQLANSDAPLTREQIIEAVTPKVSDDPSLLKEWQAIQKRIDNLITGEKGLSDTSPEAIDAQRLAKSRVGALSLMEKSAADAARVETMDPDDVVGELARLQARAAALGIVVPGSADAPANEEERALADA